jgi:hypothetical protein
MDQLAPSEVAHFGGPLDRRLALRSLAMALRPGFDVATAGDRLAALAGGNRTALLRAIARTNGGLEVRPGPVSERAGAALRWALASTRRAP